MSLRFYLHTRDNITQILYEKKTLTDYNCLENKREIEKSLKIF